MSHLILTVRVAGGHDAGTWQPLSSVEVFDPAIDRLIATGAMTAPRVDHAAALLRDGRVLLVGGLYAADRGRAWPLAELYDPASGEFTPIGGAGTTTISTEDDVESRLGPVSPRPLAVTLDDGRVLVAGWQPMGSPVVRSVHLYDPSTGRFEPVELPPGLLIRDAQDATLLPDGRALFLDGDGLALEVQLYDPTTDTWSSGGTTDGRTEATATMVDGKVLIVGGKPGRRFVDDSSLTTVEAWDPATGTFAQLDDLAVGRWGHAATALPGGRVLISGGLLHRHVRGYSVDTPASPELWDPVSRIFGDAGTMAAERVEHTATLLDDGRVLLVGGVTISPDRDDPVPVAAELYVGG